MGRRYTPYNDLPDHCFWSRAHKGVAIEDVDPVVKGGFTLTPEMKIATAGSCFAQHIARHLQSNGYNYYVTETAHPIIEPGVAKAFGYGVFSARYGNIYTSRQLRQLAERAYGQFTPEEDIWDAPDGGFIDPFRPNIQPFPFASREEYVAEREVHFAAVREMMENCDVFVFTFGLTEAWRSKRDGAVFPLAPGVAGGQFDEEAHEFINFTVAEVAEDFRHFAAMLRERNPDAKILMTVSPVPLIATARADQSVITATSYSKSVLRVVCEELSHSLADAHYFPSYEVITGNFNRGAYYAEDLRDVRDVGVAHAMRLFMRHYTDAEAGRPSRQGQLEARDSFQEDVRSLLDTICDEELIAKAVK